MPPSAKQFVGKMSATHQPEFTTKAIWGWLNSLGVQTLFTEPGSPWELGYIESFNEKLRGELLNQEIFPTLTEAIIPSILPIGLP